MENIIEKMRERGVIVYGGGRIGKQILKELKRNHILNVCVWDENAENMKDIDNIEVPDYQYEDKDIFIIICIFSIKVCKEIGEKLRKSGFSNIFYSNSEALSSIHCNYEKKEFDIRKCNQCVLTTGGCLEYSYALRQNKEINVNIGILGIVPTAKCTLSCKNCAQLTREYKSKKINCDYNCEIFKEVWKRIENVFGWIKQVTFAGGELFLHKDWKSIVTTCLDSKFVGIVSITTNGIYKLSEEDYCFLSNPKIIILLDDYTSKLRFEQRELFQETKSGFLKFGVNFVILDNTEGIWYQYGNFEKNNLEQRDLKKMYQKCVRNQCFALGTNYMFSICMRANIANDLGYINTTLEDGVDILNCEDTELIRKKVRNLLEKEYLEICQYCGGVILLYQQVNKWKLIYK